MFSKKNKVLNENKDLLEELEYLEKKKKLSKKLEERENDLRRKVKLNKKFDTLKDRSDVVLIDTIYLEVPGFKGTIYKIAITNKNVFMFENEDNSKLCFDILRVIGYMDKKKTIDKILFDKTYLDYHNFVSLDEVSKIDDLYSYIKGIDKKTKHSYTKKEKQALIDNIIRSKGFVLKDFDLLYKGD